MSDRILWGRRNAFNVQKVLWALDELQVSFDLIEVGGAFGGLDDPSFLAKNPHGRVPVLEDGGRILWESHSILRYLATQYPSDSLAWPEAPARRSEADRWMDWAQTTWQPDFMKLFWGFYRTPEAERNHAAISTAKTACENHFRLLDRELERRDFLGGDRFGLGDLPVATSLYRYFAMGAEVEEPPHVMAWYERLEQRPPFRRVICVPFEELRGRSSF